MVEVTDTEREVRHGDCEVRGLRPSVAELETSPCGPRWWTVELPRELGACG